MYSAVVGEVDCSLSKNCNLVLYKLNRRKCVKVENQIPVQVFKLVSHQCENQKPHKDF
jgi:hypothetical protein